MQHITGVDFVNTGDNTRCIKTVSQEVDVHAVRAGIVADNISKIVMRGARIHVPWLRAWTVSLQTKHLEDASSCSFRSQARVLAQCAPE